MNIKKKLSFEEFSYLLKGYGELSFSLKSVRYGALRLNEDYTNGKDKDWDRSKDSYAIYECNNPQKGWIYKTFDEFTKNAHINGLLLKDIWEHISDVEELDTEYYHGYPGAHEHWWFGDDRGPALPIKRL